MIPRRISNKIGPLVEATRNALIPRRISNKIGPLVEATRRDERSQRLRREIERRRMRLRARRASPDDVLDDIVADALENPR